MIPAADREQHNDFVARILAIEQRPDGTRRTRPPARDDRFTPVVRWALDNNVLGQLWLVPVRFTENHDQAEDVRKSLYNAARYFCSCGKRLCTRKHSNLPSDDNPSGGCPDGGQRVSVQAKIVRHEGRVRVQFAFFDKKEAIREVVAKYGPDPSKWPYFAKARRLKEN